MDSVEKLEKLSGVKVSSLILHFVCLSFCCNYLSKRPGAHFVFLMIFGSGL